MIEFPVTDSVQKLPGILFQMDARDTDTFRSILDADIDIAVFGKREFILRYLVVLRKVRVEVLFAGEVTATLTLLSGEFAMPNIPLTTQLAGTVTWHTPVWLVTTLPPWANRTGQAATTARVRKTLFFNIVLSLKCSRYG